ncbi:hypothetical protein H1C71_032770 [Ictidomys tridecemlineatus]|nr:hypothetical protein H1C71_032770 [Ictidomys tridecemlineatus]
METGLSPPSSWTGQLFGGALIRLLSFPFGDLSPPDSLPPEPRQGGLSGKATCPSATQAKVPALPSAPGRASSSLFTPVPSPLSCFSCKFPTPTTLGPLSPRPSNLETLLALGIVPKSTHWPQMHSGKKLEFQIAHHDSKRKAH